MNVRAAVIEDIGEWAEKIKLETKKILKEEEEEIEIYASAKEFLAAEKEYDIILMDVCLKDESGLKAAGEYKQRFPECVVIIVTSYNEFYKEGFKVEAFRYVEKDNLKEELKEGLEHALMRMKRIKTIGINVLDKGMIRLRYKDIVYIESLKEERRVIFHTEKESYKTFAVWLVYGTGDNFPVYILFIVAEMELLFRDRTAGIVFVTLWLASVIGVFDEISKIIVWAFLGDINNNSIWVNFAASAITVLTELIFGEIVIKINGKKPIQMNFGYFIFFFILGWAYTYIMAYLELILGDGGLDTSMHLDVIITGLVMYVHMFMLIVIAVSRDDYKEKEAFNRYLVEMLQEQYQYQLKRENDIRDFKHDVKDHMLIIQECCETENYEKLKEYVRKITDKVHINKKRVTVHNQTVDTILNQYICRAEDTEVRLKIHGQISEDCPVAPYDLCVIFANLLKNGIEAAKDSEEKSVEMTAGYEDDIMMIYMKNDYAGERKKKNGKYITTKNDAQNHGIGMGNVRESVEKYHGILSMEEEDGKFLTTIMIPLK